MIAVLREGRKVRFAVEPRRVNKSRMLDLLVDAALDAGKTVAVVSLRNGVEIRGAATAKDITPPKPLSLPVTKP